MARETYLPPMVSGNEPERRSPTWKLRWRRRVRRLGRAVHEGL